jgi:hypothetical protein
MAFFSYPVAHDNDAERAAPAGLGILDAIAQLNEQADRKSLDIEMEAFRVSPASHRRNINSFVVRGVGQSLL